jgi:hypothetical protein
MVIGFSKKYAFGFLAACLRSATETAPKSLLVAPDRCMYRLAIIATCAAGVDNPCGYENELSTPVESAFSTNRICTWPKRILALVESPVCDNAFRDTSRYRDRRLLDRRAVTDPDGKLLLTTKRSIFARGEGGFGGERGPSTSVEPPDRAPDIEVPLPILPQQALLYRLCSDRIPLHSDPEFAAAAGFPRPILHGLCTYGIACKAIVDTVLDGDVSRVHSYGALVSRGGVPRRDTERQRLKGQRHAAGSHHRAEPRRRGRAVGGPAGFGVGRWVARRLACCETCQFGLSGRARCT